MRLPAAAEQAPGLLEGRPEGRRSCPGVHPGRDRARPPRDGRPGGAAPYAEGHGAGAGAVPRELRGGLIAQRPLGHERFALGLGSQGDAFRRTDGRDVAVDHQ
ncbi:protein of unknown function [Streptomyces murinus]